MTQNLASAPDEFAAMRHALLEVNRVPSAIIHEQLVQTKENLAVMPSTLPTSHVRNQKITTPQKYVDALWIASHGCLRDMVALSGELLSTEHLDNAEAFVGARKEMLAARNAYRDMYEPFLACARPRMCNADGSWIYGPQIHGIPSITEESRFSLLCEDLLAKDIAAYYDRESIPVQFERAERNYNDAFTRMFDLLALQKTVPLAWKDTEGNAHLEQLKPYDPGVFCHYLAAAHFASTLGQTDLSLVTRRIRISLGAAVAITSKTMFKLDKQLFALIDKQGSPTLKQHLVRQFSELRHTMALKSLLADPVIDTHASNSTALRDARAALIPLPIPAPGFAARFSLVPPSPETRCPVAHTPPEHGSTPEEKHWCVQVLEGLGHVPAQLGHGRWA